jgi:hypothetical protein
MTSALVAALRQQGGVLSEVVDADTAPRPQEPGPPQIGAHGPRTAGREADYELLLEMILEGSRLHYGEPRVVRNADPDLALLLGDQLYALGLARLAAIGDLEAVRELADVISLVAQAHAAAAPGLADAAWRAGAVAVGWGSSEAHTRAKQRARAGHRDAESALRAVAAS